MQIVPSLLATTEEKYQKDYEKLAATDIFNDKWVHIDVMDNKFVQSLSIDPEIMEKYPLESDIEVHLMVEDVFDWIQKFEDLSVKRFIAHAEIGDEKIKQFISLMKEKGLEVGLALNPEITLSGIEEYLEDLDLILIMTIHPGFQGQKMIPEMLEKVRDAGKIRSEKNLKYDIEMDGGANESTLFAIKESGVDLAVSGSGLFKYDNLEEGLKVLETAANGRNSTT